MILNAKFQENVLLGEGVHGVMVNALDCSLERSKFKLQSRYYVRFRIYA